MGMRVKAVWKPREEWGTTSRTSATSRRPASRTRTTRPTRGAPVRLQGRRGRRVRPAPDAGCDGRHTCGSSCWCRSSPSATSRPAGPERDIGFWCSGSSDYLAGRSFSFVPAVDAIGVFPPVNESHVEMDAAWALYEAWVKIQTGEVDTALVYGFGKSSAGRAAPDPRAAARPVHDRRRCGPTPCRSPALQARLGIDAGLWTRRTMAEVAARSRRRGEDEPARAGVGSVGRGRCWPRPYVRRPAAQARLRPGHRRRRGDRARRRRPGPRAVRAARPGSPASRTASTRISWAPAT